jgi:hypothetical protein
LTETTETLVPRDLARLLRELLDGGTPDEPFDAGV